MLAGMFAGMFAGVGDFVILTTHRRARLQAQLGLASAFIVLTASVTILLVAPLMSKPVAFGDVGTVAPDFSLSDGSGATFSLANCRGQVVVLFFSPLQAAGSVEYAETLKTFARNYDTDSRVKFASVNIGNGTTLDAPLPRLNAQLAADNIPMLLDTRAAVAARYSATSAPTVVIIDPRGVVCYRGAINNLTRSTGHSSFTSHSLLADALNNVLDERTVAVASK